MRRKHIVAYEGNPGDIGPICHGQKGTLCIAGESSVSLFDCNESKFTLKRRLSVMDDLAPSNICYLEDHDFIVISSTNSNRLCALRSSDGQIVWNKTMETWCPNTLIFLQNQGVLLVGDKSGGNVSAVSPSTGDVLQKFKLQDGAETIKDLHIVDNKLLVHLPKRLAYCMVR